MDNAQVSHVIKFLNASWTAKPLDGPTAAIWGGKLKAHDFVAVMAVLEDLVVTLEWRPSLAQILKPLLGDPSVRSPSEAFSNVWDQIPKRPPVVSDSEAEAVRRLGGWSVLRSWQLNERHWHGQRFAEIYREVSNDARDDKMRAIAAGRQPAALTEGTT